MESAVAVIAHAIQNTLASRAQQRITVMDHHTEVAPADSPASVATMAGKNVRHLQLIAVRCYVRCADITPVTSRSSAKARLSCSPSAT